MSMWMVTYMVGQVYENNLSSHKTEKFEGAWANEASGPIFRLFVFSELNIGESPTKRQPRKHIMIDD